MKLEPNEVSLSSAVHACALAKRWRLGLSRGFLEFISIPWAWRLFRRSQAPKEVFFSLGRWHWPCCSRADGRWCPRCMSAPFDVHWTSTKCQTSV